MKLRPLSNYALIKPNEEDEQSSGGIYLPSSARETPQTGEVIAIGPGHNKVEYDKSGKETGKTFVKTVVKAGETVMYEKYGGTTYEIEGKKYLLVREENILGYVE